MIAYYPLSGADQGGRCERSKQNVNFDAIQAFQSLKKGFNRRMHIRGGLRIAFHARATDIISVYDQHGDLQGTL
jgi:hypothetical protein